MEPGISGKLETLDRMVLDVINTLNECVKIVGGKKKQMIYSLRGLLEVAPLFKQCITGECYPDSLLRRYALLVTALYLFVDYEIEECINRNERVRIFDKAFNLATELTLAKLKA